MSYSRREVEIPERPILIVALEGWIDPGYAAATAVASLLDQYRTRTLAVFDTDELIDLRARRPHVRIDDGVRGRIFWPGPRLRVGTDSEGAGVAFLVGAEPDYRWRPFATEVVGLAAELGCPLIVGLGAFPAPTPHTRPIPVTSTSSDRELTGLVGYRPGSYDRPARMVDVLGSFSAEHGIPSISLVARVPHYVSTTPFPPASIALLDALAKVTGLSISTEALHTAAANTADQIDELISASEEHIAMVRQLETQYDDDSAATVSSEIPSGDEIAAELERYLRGEIS